MGMQATRNGWWKQPEIQDLGEQNHRRKVYPPVAKSPGDDKNQNV